jgi:hydroxymethylpyrimidine/phosphomethylpyrimidine kinase
LGPSEVLRNVPTALTIAGSDSGGGAGIQADLKTFFALGVHGTSALTALTAQNTKGVTGIHPAPADFVTQQIETVAADLPIGAAKTGMLATAEIVEAVAAAVRDLRIKNLVVDPVFVSKSRDRLLAEDAVGVLKERLFPAALVITPNLHEAGALLGREVSTLDEMKSAAKALKDFGPAFVLVKGGHLAGEAIDVLYDGVAIIELSAERIDSPHTHGTGCTLSAAIAAYLARGEPVVEAIGKAKSFITGAIRHGLAIGSGSGPVNPGWAISPGGAETS